MAGILMEMMILLHNNKHIHTHKYMQSCIKIKEKDI